MPHAPALIALTQPAPATRPRSEQARAARELAALLTGVTIVLVIFLLIAVLLLIRRRVFASAGRPHRRGRPPPSAWAEAGRRAPSSDDDDDTIDEDPRDLSSGDIRPGSGPTPAGS